MAHYGTTSALAVFFLATLVLAVTPGPAVIYLVTRTLAEGRGAGLASIGGIVLGNLGNAAVACLGLGAALAISSRAFTVVRFLGAAYLLWLGIQALRATRERGVSASMPAPVPAPASPGAPPRAYAFRDGFWVALLNPKTAMFFAAFLPQFIDPRAASPLALSLSLAGLFVATAACTDTLYVLAAGALRGRLGARAIESWSRYVAAFVYLTLGTLVAFSEARPGR